jgi:glutamyl endopeptidase
MAKSKNFYENGSKESEFEVPNEGVSTLDQPNTSITDDREDNTPAVEYEKVGNLDFNIRNPEREASNNKTATEAQESNSMSGNFGRSMATEAEGDFTLDAIYGSYRELRERAINEVIIGADNRVRINPTTTYPWRAVCALKITAANGSRYIGTGWLISPRTVITAGHVVYLHDEGGWASSIEVVPAQNDAARPYGSFSGNALRSTQGWVNSKNRDFDYGAIILPANSRPGDTVGYFGFAVRDDNFLMNSALNLSGYPGDKGGNQQWFMAQKPKAVSSKVITYDIDTVGGQSGSPVWVLQNGNRYGVGIHTNGVSTGNSATRIDQSVYNNLLTWKNLGL